MTEDFTKEYFQQAWGEGYYERFTFGVGIDKVFERCILPFVGLDKTALEIGPGGGAFTELMINRFAHLTAIDVIKMPTFFNYNSFTYHELPNRDYSCRNVNDNSIDFCFSYGLFCHLSNIAITQYVKSINRVLKPGGDLVFMLSNFEHARNHVDNPGDYVLGDRLPMGHFYQDIRTLDIVIGEGWDIVDMNMIPEHRDILVHLKKKEYA